MSRIDRGTDAKVDRARTRASSESRRAAYIRRLLAGRSRRSIAFLALIMLLGATGVALAGPSGSIVDGVGTQNAHGLAKFGPVNPDIGFPDWYRDTNNVELEPCIDARDPNCNAPPVPDPSAAPTFPDNFPDEFFYMLADVNMTANGDNPVLAEFAVEGAFATKVQNGDQMVFGRTRYRVRGGLQPDTDYTITNPYGVDVVHTDADADDLFVTEDVGITPGAFGEALGGQVGPFLTWTGTDAPAGYIGDPAVPHTVKGSPFQTNFVKIEGPGIGGDNNPNPCPGFTETTSPDCIYTDQFNLTGKKSTRGGVQVARATYSRSADGATTQIDVLADSKAGQDLVVQDQQLGAARRFGATPLEADGERYFAHVDVTTLPDTVDVVNRGDNPKTVKHVNVVDQVVGTAVYDAGSDNLHVTAQSSDKLATDAGPAAKLSLPDYQTDLDAAGAADVKTTVPPDTVKVASSQGGTVDVPVQIQGPGMAPLPLAANAGADQTVEQGTTVTLDGIASTGNIDTFHWIAPPGITLTGADTAKPTFTAPDTAGPLTFTLEVTGPDGTLPTVKTVTDEVVVTVNPVTRPVAKIAINGALTTPGTPVNVPQNMPITLDGTQSTGAGAFAWTQTNTPAIDLGTTTNEPKLTFTFPKTRSDVVVRLQVRQAGLLPTAACTARTCDSVNVRLRPIADRLTIVKARYVASGSRWVVDGTASSTLQNNVQVYSGSSLDPSREIGSSPVLADGTWSVDARGSKAPLTTCGCVTVVSDRGGQISNFPLEKPENLPPTDVPPTIPGAPTTQTLSSASIVGAVPLAGGAVDAGTGAAALAAPTGVTAPGTVTPAAFGTGVRVTFNAPAGTNIAQLRVLTSNGKQLFKAFHKVKGGTKVTVKIRSSKLRRQLRAGKRYVIQVRTGKTKAKLSKPASKTFRVRR